MTFANMRKQFSVSQKTADSVTPISFYLHIQNHAERMPMPLGDFMLFAETMENRHAGLSSTVIVIGAVFGHDPYHFFKRGVKVLVRQGFYCVKIPRLYRGLEQQAGRGLLFKKPGALDYHLGGLVKLAFGQKPPA